MLSPAIFDFYIHMMSTQNSIPSLCYCIKYLAKNWADPDPLLKIPECADEDHFPEQSYSLYVALQNLLSRVRPNHTKFTAAHPDEQLTADIPEGFNNSYTEILNHLPTVLNNNKLDLEVRSINASMSVVLCFLVERQPGRVEHFATKGTLTALVKLLSTTTTESTDSSLENFQDSFVVDVGRMIYHVSCFGQQLAVQITDRVVDDGIVGALKSWTYDRDSKKTTSMQPSFFHSSHEPNDVLLYPEGTAIKTLASILRVYVLNGEVPAGNSLRKFMRQLAKSKSQGAAQTAWKAHSEIWNTIADIAKRYQMTLSEKQGDNPVVIQELKDALLLDKFETENESSATEKVCGVCNKSGKIFECSTCRSVVYCSKACQKLYVHCRLC